MKVGKQATKEFYELKKLEIRLCPDYGRLTYSPSDDHYLLVTSDSDTEAKVQKALSMIAAVVGESRVTAESEAAPYPVEAANYASADYEAWGDEFSGKPLDLQGEKTVEVEDGGVDNETAVEDVFKSKAQQGFLYAKHPEVAKEFAEHTTKKQFERLPEHIDDSGVADEAIDAKAHEAAASPLNDKAPPSHSQMQSGNYAKGHVKVGPLDIAIENPSGSKRRPEWPALSDHYGYLKGSVGADKDHVDVFVRPGTDEAWQGDVHVVNQLRADGSFDEHKCMVGWDDPETALHAYLANYSAGQSGRVGGVVTLPLREFLSWAKDKGPSGPRAGALQPKAVSSDADDGSQEELGDEEKERPPDDTEATADSYADFVNNLVALVDSKKDGVLGKLVQTMTRTGAKTRHGYVYDTPVVQRAIEDARERVRAGAMLSEKHHPQLVADAADKNGRRPKFVSNYNNVTARVTAISDVMENGWVTIEREILDVPDGRRIWEDAKKGTPWALSVRWLTDAEAKRTGRPKWMELATVDDVEVPAVDGAGALLALMDSFDEEEPHVQAAESMTDPSPETPEGLGEPFYGVNRNTVNPYPRGEADPEVEKVARGDEAPIQSKKMSEALKQARAFASLVAKKAKRDELSPAMKNACLAIKDEWSEGEDVSNAVATLKNAKKALADADTSAAYHPGVEGPYIELGNQLMMDPKSGWGPDLRDVPENDTSSEDRQVQQSTKGEVHGVAITADEAEKKKEEEEKEEKKKEVEAKMDEVVNGDPDWTGLTDFDKNRVTRMVLRKAATADDVQAVYDETMGPIKALADSAKKSQEKLAALGFDGGLLVKSATTDVLNPIVRRVSQDRPGAAAVEKLLSISDDFHRAGPMVANLEIINPDDPNVRARRQYNMRKMAPLMDAWEDRIAEKSKNGKDKFYAALSDSDDVDSMIQSSANAIALADSYTSAIAQVPNQPVIWRWLLTQAFQDQRALAFCSAIGPGQASESGQGWEDRVGLGRVFKVPYESYVDPTGTGFEYGGLDLGLFQTENSGVTEGTVALYWDTFFPQWRGLAASMTIQGIKSIGNGPLNYALGMRNIWHMLARKSRSIDKACFDEMARVALEYGATAVSAETYTAGNNGLANQTVYSNGSATVPGASATACVVNLNTTKTAAAAVVIATDDYAVYPVPNVTPGSGGAAPIAAVRLLSGTAVGAAAAPYFATNGVCKNPTVPPRLQRTLTSAGADLDTTINPFTVSAPAAMVAGYLGPDGYIYSAPGTTATYAVDYMNGVLLFASGVANNGGVIGTTVTVSYSYSTNFDYFPLTPGLNGLASLATGETPAEFSNRLLAQFDFTAGAMASWPRFVAPDLSIMSALVSPNITEATAFYKLNSPKDTDLYPTEEFFATRNGVDMARINTPWFVGETALLMTRRNTTKYAIDTPSEVRGPFVKYDTNGNVIPGEAYYLMENSAIITPQVKDGSGVIINPVARFILLLQGGKQSCGVVA